MAPFDPGTPPAVARLFGQLRSYTASKKAFWFDWGPIFHRDRLNKSARILCVAQDPGPSERVANRKLVGGRGVPVFRVLHPSSHAPVALLNDRQSANTGLRATLTPDSKAQVDQPNLGAAPCLGDAAWMRQVSPPHPSNFTRLQPDNRHTLISKAPTH